MPLDLQAMGPQGFFVPSARHNGETAFGDDHARHALLCEARRGLTCLGVTFLFCAAGVAGR